MADQKKLNSISIDSPDNSKSKIPDKDPYPEMSRKVLSGEDQKSYIITSKKKF